MERTARSCGAYELVQRMYHDRDDTRFERTIKLSESELRAAVRVLSALARETSPSPVRELPAVAPVTEVEFGGPTEPLDEFAVKRQATRILQLRQRRQKHFPPSIFGEPAWDILLRLYVSDGRAFSIRQLSDDCGLPATTALRWIDYLAQQNLVSRKSHPTDLRTVVVRLTEAAEHTLDLYFSETLKASA